ncbi:hypothetical protein MKX01_042393 [Papaver californicum]|nr:hypothetical protein MKX01_042393 [Papaver californicum]
MANYSTKLSLLYMGNNRLFGSIPTGLENLVSLNGLAMERNMLTGSIPDSIVVHIVDPAILVPLNFQAMNCEIEAKMSEALTRIVKLGVGCSTNSPGERMEMVQVVKELQSIKNMYLLDLDMEL